MSEDQNHLRILSIFHYVVAGLAALYGCFNIFQAVSMLSFFQTGFGSEFGEVGPVFPSSFGLMFLIIPLIVVTLLGAYALAMVYAAGSLTRYESHTFCLVMAGISCIFLPFGTVLGIFTIVVLLRPSVKALFNGEMQTGLPTSQSF